MSEIDADGDPKTPDGWLDTWLTEVSKTDNMRLRGNAAIALATLGGPARIDEFIELVGDTAIKMKAGRSGAAEAVAVALREVERPDFDREGLTRAFERSKNDDRPERLAARALLMPAHPVVAWWRLRAIAPWAGLGRTLVLAAPLAAGALVSLVLAMAVLIDWRGGFELAAANGTPLFFLFLGVVAGSVFIARVAVAGQRSRVGLILDGLACGLLAGSPLLVFVLAAATDKSLNDGPHVVPFLWAIFVGAVLALASVRVFVGVSPTGRRRLPAVLSAIAWPVSVVTVVALLAAALLGGLPGKGMDLALSVLSWTWVTFIVAAPAVAVGVGAADDLRRTSLAPFSVFRPPHPTVLLIVPVIAIAAVLADSRKHVEPFPVSADEVSGPFTIVNDRPFKLTFADGSPKPGKDGLELAFEPLAKDYVLDVGHGDYVPIQGEDHVAPPYERVDQTTPDAPPPPPSSGPPASPANAVASIQITEPSKTPLGRHYLLKDGQVETLCMVKRDNRRCGVPVAHAGWWLQILTGRTERLGDHKALTFYTYRPAPPRADPVALPDQAPGDWQRTAAGGFTRSIRPSEARPALQLDVQRPYFLRVKPVLPDPILDRVVVVQQVDSKDSYTVWSADDPDPPHLNMRLEPNHTYLVCLRLVHAMFLDCTHQTRGMLSEEISLTLAPNRPAELGSDLPPMPVPPMPAPGSRKR